VGTAAVVGCTAVLSERWAAALVTMGATAAVATGTEATAMVAMVAPAGGMGSGCAAAAVATMARPTTGTVTIEGAGGSAAGTVDAAVLGCTAAAGTVGGAKRERDTHPSNSPALGAGEACALPPRFLGDRVVTGWLI
jgi:hypothetical protein